MIYQKEGRSVAPPIVAIIFTALSIFLFYSLFEISVTELSQNQLTYLSSSLRFFSYCFVVFTLLIIMWTIYHINTVSKGIMFIELYTCFTTILCSIAVYALVYKTNGLIKENTLVYPTASESFLFSVSMFTSNGIMRGMEPSDQEIFIASVQQLSGFLITPMIISMLFVIISKKH